MLNTDLIQVNILLAWKHTHALMKDLDQTKEDRSQQQLVDLSEEQLFILSADLAFI